VGGIIFFSGTDGWTSDRLGRELRIDSIMRQGPVILRNGMLRFCRIF
jgi:hypothetical protein